MEAEDQRLAGAVVVLMTADRPEDEVPGEVLTYQVGLQVRLQPGEVCWTPVLVTALNLYSFYKFLRIPRIRCICNYSVIVPIPG